jgi:hypothetical protein
VSGLLQHAPTTHELERLYHELARLGAPSVGRKRPGSTVRSYARHLGRNLAPYARWGFIGHERPTADAATKRTVGRYDARTRRQILDELLEKAGWTTLADYLEAIDQAISRQQALLDLKAHPQLRVEGHGRGARWQRIAPPSAGRKRPR